MKRISAKHRRAIKIALRVLFASGFVAIVVLLLLAQRKPSWYTPVHLTPDDLPRLRRDVTRQLDDISRNMVHREPFAVTWTQEQLTERLAAFPDLWPEARQAWPPELSDPVVKIDKDAIRIGAFVERSGWRAIVSANITTDVTTDSANESRIRVQLREATVGSLSAPRWLLKRWFDKQLAHSDSFALPTSRDTDLHRKPHATIHATDRLTIDRLFNGLLIPNNFTWPNGQRPFRITRITTSASTITIHIQPT